MFLQQDGINMRKHDNIFVKLQIEKDRNSGELTLNIQFDKDTPNFFTDKNVISWCPTIEEINFLNEAFELISKRKGNKQKKMNVYEKDAHEEKTDDHLKASNEEKVIDSKHEKGSKDEDETTSLSDSEKKDVNEWFV